MFDATPAPEFTEPVQLSVPGKEACEVVHITYRHKGKTALAKWWAAYLQAPSVQALGEVIAGWDMRRAGEPLAYTPAALDALCEDYPAAMGELSDAYMHALVRSRRKN